MNRAIAARRGRPTTPLEWVPSPRIVSDLANGPTLQQFAYESLRQAMLTGMFKPGQAIALRPLAEAMGLSATPVREALRQLVQDGAVELEARSGFRIAVIPPARYLQILEMRVRLECLALEMAIPAVDGALISQLRAFNDQFHEEGSALARNALPHNHALHFGLYQLSGAPDLVKTIASVWVQIGPAINFVVGDKDDLEQGFATHSVLLDALEAGDSQLAISMLEHDLRQGGRAIVRGLEELSARVSNDVSAVPRSASMQR